MANSLKETSILLTRPKPQGDALCKLLEEHGAKVFHIPAMGIAAVNKQDQADSISHTEFCFSQLTTYDAIIFVSINAAQHALPWFEQHLLSEQLLYCMGKSTFSFLQKHSLSAIYPQQMDSEGLLDLADFQQDKINKKRLLILRGISKQGTGRKKLADTLIERGAKVDECGLYRRYLPEESIVPLQQNLPLCDLLIVNSGESLHNLNSMLASNMKSLLFKKTLLVASQRIAKSANKMGFKHIIVADNATDDAILNAVVNHYSTNPKR